MYAIVSTGSKQYKVEKGDIIDVELLDAEPNENVSLDVVLLSDGKKALADPASLAKKKVKAQVLDHHKAKKVVVFKFHKRKRYQRTKGHRQNLTRLEIKTVPSLTESKKSAE